MLWMDSDDPSDEPFTTYMILRPMIPISESPFKIVYLTVLIHKKCVYMPTSYRHSAQQMVNVSNSGAR